MFSAVSIPVRCRSFEKGALTVAVIEDVFDLLQCFSHLFPVPIKGVSGCKNGALTLIGERLI